MLELTEDEAYALLGLCMTSEMPCDAETDQVLEKLASFCKSHVNGTSNHKKPAACELEEAG